MKNFKITSKEDNKKYWISRSCAVATFVFVFDNSIHKWCVLANKRGSGTPDFQGYWNCPCGYIDYDETGEEAAVREVFEETGYKISSSDLTLYDVNTDPNDSIAQNITLRYYIFLHSIPDFEKNHNGGELNEVEEVTLIPVDDIFNEKYKWAFNHNILINDIFKREINVFINMCRNLTRGNKL